MIRLDWRWGRAGSTLSCHLRALRKRRALATRAGAVEAEAEERPHLRAADRAAALTPSPPAPGQAGRRETQARPAETVAASLRAGQKSG